MTQGISDKKTDEIISRTDEVEIKFRPSDYLRMLIGIILFTSIISKLSTGRFIVYPLSNGTTKNNLEISSFWYDNYQNVPIAFSESDLKQYSGDSVSERIVLSIKGNVFDVTRGARFYGKWGPYKKFSGKDCSNVFGYNSWDLSSLSKECNSNISELSTVELERIDSWLSFFKRKYPYIGYVRYDD
ncbi:hypothetical protein TPHA_0B01630 [Tetrapisispora phaffii CBS 4417]|uniref:Cytochrome b5 heme-binding domain-containing protein n=1 Tax=Tetrapisispora phaffii (strain ATCC 24235 / CBS 4417 / NBRC 1672 / NRRL Y-8282 / UCD 70-5) TaxID=1071381 RepID=G8BPA6_TETPH|nr:hypothetical protein TPHA_0B01630 [Tetrapisispora phaffii CBS 4417]CCE61837.1 hypothetical protein TPHA_0B01630 [Tetrapisispora phaffii CBS 4417]